VSFSPRTASSRRPALRASATAHWPRAQGLRLAPLIQATRLDDLLPMIARLAEEVSLGQEAFVLLLDGACAPDEASARNGAGRPVSPAVYRNLFRGPAMTARLARGLHVQQIDADGGVRLLLPLVHDSALRAALGVTIPVTTRPLSRIVETLRDVSQQAAPLLARLLEIEDLRRVVGGLTALVQQGAECEARLRAQQDELRAVRVQATMQKHLVAEVNHALRTPLVAIRGYTRLLLDEPAGLEGTPRQYLDVVARNAERLVEVAQNLTAPGAARLKLERVDLASCWDQALVAAREAAAARGVTLVERLPEEPVTATADVSRLRQMLAELASGALETAARDDELCLDLVAEAHRLVVTATTTRAADHPEPGRAKEKPAPGLSLRLDTVREIANLHGGRLAIAGDGVRGRAVSVVLPRVELEEQD